MSYNYLISIKAYSALVAAPFFLSQDVHICNTAISNLHARLASSQPGPVSTRAIFLFFTNIFLTAIDSSKRTKHFFFIISTMPLDWHISCSSNVSIRYSFSLLDKHADITCKAVPSNRDLTGRPLAAWSMSCCVQSDDFFLYTSFHKADRSRRHTEWSISNT